MQLALAAGNGVGVQASDLGQVGDSSPAMLLGEKADQEPSGAFVGGSDETVDATMLPGQSTMRMLLAGGAIAHMDDTTRMLLGHRTVPLGPGREKTTVILPEVH